MAYALPTSADLILRYPEFEAIDPARIDYWLQDALRFVDESWTEEDYPVAIMAMAAHNMWLRGFLATSSSGSSGGTTGGTSPLPLGLTSIRSGALSLSFTEKSANARASGSLEGDPYGAEYLLLLRRNKAGPRVTASGRPVYGECGYPGILWPEGWGSWGY